MMILNSIKYGDVGLETVYKDPRVEVISVSEIAVACQNSQPSTLFAYAASRGYLVELSIPKSCYAEVLEVLEKEPLITKINSIKTESGQKIEDKVSNILNQVQDDQENEPDPSGCCIM